MKITKKNQAISKLRPDGTKINYYIFDEFEVHSATIESNVKQPWHHHTKQSEIIYVISGKIQLEYVINDKKIKRVIKPEEIVEVENTPHTFTNPFSQACKMMAFRFIKSGKPTQHIIKSDKVLDPEFEDEN